MAAKARRLVVVSNRVADFTAKFQTGGLAVALGDALKASHGLWFGWSGETAKDASGAEPKVETVSGLTVATIDLTPEEAEGYYYGYANRCLWPALHYRLDLAQCNEEHNEIYFNVSARFADALMPLIGPDDLIWVHDYHLIPLAEELRGRGCTSRIGFFLHTPFPSPEIFAAVPGQKRLGNALMVYDVVGFQTCSDRDNFRRYVAAFLDGEQLRGDRIAAQGETTLASVFPIGIDAAAFRKLAESESAKGPILPVLGEDMKTIIGVDRLDYTKGLRHRLKAYEELLAEGEIGPPEATFVQIATPSRERVESYRTLRTELETTVGRINGEYSAIGAAAVHYFHQSFPREEMAAFFLAADVMLVTPLRDGMNLVAKEYVTCRHDHGGALVLSEFTGAWHELHQAYVCNPHDIEGLKQTILKAIRSPEKEKRRLMKALRRRVGDHDVQRWASRFLSALEYAPERPPKPQSSRPRKE